MQFINPSRGRLSIGQVAEDIRAFREEMPEAVYKLIVGADSQPQSARYVTMFATAIIVHRVGKGARRQRAPGPLGGRRGLGVGSREASRQQPFADLELGEPVELDGQGVDGRRA